MERMLISGCLKAAAAFYDERKKVTEKVSLFTFLCVLVTTPPSSNVPFSAHMVPIRQRDLHDVSVCVCACVHGEWQGN